MNVPMDTSKQKQDFVFHVTATKMVLNQTLSVISKLALVNAKKILPAGLVTNVVPDFSTSLAVKSVLVTQLVFTTTIPKYAAISMLVKNVHARSMLKANSVINVEIDFGNYQSQMLLVVKNVAVGMMVFLMKSKIVAQKMDNVNVKPEFVLKDVQNVKTDILVLKAKTILVAKIVNVMLEEHLVALSVQ